MNGKSWKDRVTVAREKADFIADRIAAGVPAPEEDLRRLARYLREIASEMGPGLKKPRPGPGDPETIASHSRGSDSGRRPGNLPQR